MASKVWVEVDAAEKGNSSNVMSTLEDQLAALLKLDPQRREEALFSHETPVLHKIAMKLRFDNDVSDETLIRFIKAVLMGSQNHGAHTQANLHLLFLAIFKRMEERPFSPKLANFLAGEYIGQAIIYALPGDCSVRRDMRLRMCNLQTRLLNHNKYGGEDDDDVPPLCSCSAGGSSCSDDGSEGDDGGKD
jgi:hypothetical protein